LKGRKASLPSRSGLTSSFTNLGNQSVPNLERIKKNPLFATLPAGKDRKEASYRETYRDIHKVPPTLYSQKQDQSTHMHRPSHATGLRP